LDIFAKDYPMSCAEYAKCNGLLDTLDWKRYCHLAKNGKNVERMVNQANLNSYQQESFWKFGFLVPHMHGQANEIDLANGNIKWHDSEAV
jgi:hypothetical protein